MRRTQLEQREDAIRRKEHRIRQLQAEIASLRAEMDMPPTHRLPLGTRVRLMGDGLRQFPGRESERGTVVRHCRLPGLVAVDWDGRGLQDEWTEDYLLPITQPILEKPKSDDEGGWR